MKLIMSLPFPSLWINLIYAVYNGVIGFATKSWWFVTLGAYYIVLSVMRFAVIRSEHTKDAQFCRKFAGVMFIFLSVCLSGTVVLSAVEDRGTKYHEIVMITIALYAFTKLTLGIINLVRSGKSEIDMVLRNISLEDAFVSIFSLQRSMLVSFPGMEEGDIRLMNILTGSGVCIVVLMLGINLIDGRFFKMAKSKIVKVNEKIAEVVVGGYKKIETTVVDGYTKIENKFVDAYLTKDGETVEEAKKRLKK